MGHQHQRLSVLFRQLGHNFHNFACGLRIEIARRLVGKHNGGLLTKARAIPPLLLPTTHLCWSVGEMLPQPHPL